MVRFDAKLYSLVNFGSFSLSYGFSERESVFFDDFSTFFNQKNHEFSLKIQSFWLRKIKFFEPGPAGPGRALKIFSRPGPAQPGPQPGRAQVWTCMCRIV